MTISPRSSATPVAAVLGALLLLGVFSAAASAQSNRGVQGDFSAILNMHTTSSAVGPLPGVRPWDGRAQPGVFIYRSIPCTGLAPVNNLSSDLPSYGGRVPGSRAPSSMRAIPFAFRVVRTRGGQRAIRGFSELVVCKLGPGPTPDPDPIPDAAKPKIRMSFIAPFARTSGETAHFQGRFRISGGTQRYAGLSGSGTISGYVFCLDPQGCAATGGQYRDGQFSLQGSYADRTP